MAKKTKRRKSLTRRQLARREKEARVQRIMTWVAAGVGLLVVGILVYGLVTEVFIKARKPVARVGETVIQARDFEARQSYERWMTQLQIYQYQAYLDQINQSGGLGSLTGTPSPDGEGTAPQPSAQDTVTDTQTTDPLVQQIQLTVSNLERQLSPDLANVFAGRILDSMIEEELVRQEAETRDLTATEDEIQLGIEQVIGYDRNAVTETITDTAVAGGQMQYDELYQQFETNVLQVTRYPEEDFRAMVRANVLRDKLKAELGEDIEETADQVKAILLTVENEEQAEALRTRINEEGADPEALIDELSNDDSAVSTGYELPWLPLGYIGGQLSAEIERAAFNTPVGVASTPVLGPDENYNIVYVIGHEERELSSQLLEQNREQAYQNWLSEAKNERSEYLDWEEFVITE